MEADEGHQNSQPLLEKSVLNSLLHCNYLLILNSSCILLTNPILGRHCSDWQVWENSNKSFHLHILGRKQGNPSIDWTWAGCADCYSSHLDESHCSIPGSFILCRGSSSPRRPKYASRIHWINMLFVYSRPRLIRTCFSWFLAIVQFSFQMFWFSLSSAVTCMRAGKCGCVHVKWRPLRSNIILRPGPPPDFTAFFTSTLLARQRVEANVWL